MLEVTLQEKKKFMGTSKTLNTAIPAAAAAACGQRAWWGGH